MDDRLKHSHAALRRFTGDSFDDLAAGPGEHYPLETALGLWMNEGDLSNLN